MKRAGKTVAGRVARRNATEKEIVIDVDPTMYAWLARKAKEAGLTPGQFASREITHRFDELMAKAYARALA